MKITSMFAHISSPILKKQNWTDLHYLYVSNHFGENKTQNPMMSQYRQWALSLRGLSEVGVIVKGRSLVCLHAADKISPRFYEL